MTAKEFTKEAPKEPEKTRGDDAGSRDNTKREIKAEQVAAKRKKRETDSRGQPLMPVAEQDKPLPRLIKPDERAFPGTKRYKVLARNYRPRPTRYVLVKEGKDQEKEAREEYLRATGLEELIKQLKASGVKEPEPPLLFVKELTD